MICLHTRAPIVTNFHVNKSPFSMERLLLRPMHLIKNNTMFESERI